MNAPMNEQQLRARVAALETHSSRVRTDELVPGDRVWHPYDMACFTVAEVASEGSTSRLRFHNRVTDEHESGMRVTGTDDNGETVHVDCAPSYLWHREDAASEVARLRARIAELEAERHSTNEALSDAAVQLRVQRDRIAELEAALVCPSVASLYGSKCVLPIRHSGDHQNETKRHYWSDDYAVPQQRGMGPGERRLAERTFSELEATHWKRLGIDPPQQEDPHDRPLHHDYAVPRDLPFIPGQTTGRCAQGHTFEDCTCGGAA